MLLGALTLYHLLLHLLPHLHLHNTRAGCSSANQRVRTSRETTVWRTHLVDLQQRAHTRAHAPISTWSPRIAYSIKYAIRLSQSHQKEAKPRTHHSQKKAQFNTSTDQTNIPSE